VPPNCSSRSPGKTIENQPSIQCNYITLGKKQCNQAKSSLHVHAAIRMLTKKRLTGDHTKACKNRCLQSSGGATQGSFDDKALLAFQKHSLLSIPALFVHLPMCSSRSDASYKTTNQHLANQTTDCTRSPVKLLSCTDRIIMHGSSSHSCPLHNECTVYAMPTGLNARDQMASAAVPTSNQYIHRYSFI